MIGQQLGPYQILAKLGEGGMGEVWKARDTRLNRDVAIKTSHEKFNDRFDREARAIAALNHPQICQLYDVGPDYLVMEYVDGTPIAPVDTPRKLLDIAVQLGEGLAAAHAAGIVHRDLKPGNILITREGRVKILDFGLAKSTGGSSEEVTSAPLTEAGSAVGTVAYMSPEQARGDANLTAQSDQFSLGLVLYELASGQRPFRGGSAAETMTAIIREEPAPLAATVPAPLRWIIERLLSKEPADRYDSTRDLYRELRQVRDRLTTDGTSQVEASAASVGARSRRSSRLPWVVSTLSMLVAAVSAAYVVWRPAPVAPVQYSSIPPPDNTVFETIASSTAGGPVLSADGSKLAFIARDSQGKTMLYVQPLNAPKAEVMPGTEGANYPFWSPDGRSLGYFKDSQVWKIEAAGGPPEIVCRTCSSQLTFPQKGGAWNDAGTILFGFGAGPGAPPLSRVAAGGGVGEQVFALEPGDSAHRWPQFLPDGRHFLFYVSSANPDAAGMYAGSLDSPGRTLVVHTNAQAQYVAPGHLLFMRDDTLMAQPFDPGRLTTSGTAAPIADHVATVQQSSRAVFSASGTGALVYQTAAAGTGLLQLTWFDRQGKATGTLGTLDYYLDPAISPDGRRVAVSIGPAGRNDIWVFDLAQGTKTRLTLGPGASHRPLWTPDGASIVFTATRTGQAEHIYQKPADNSGPEEEVPGGGASESAWSLSRDGRYMAIVRTGADKRWSIWVLPRVGDRTPIPINPTEGMQAAPAISPDGKWLAYGSLDPGAKVTDAQVFVTPFPGGGSRWQVSTGGGAPQWRDDGRELYFETADSLHVMAVEVSVRGAAPQFGTPYPVLGATMMSAINGAYATVDGKKFLANVINNDSRTPLTLVTNWTGLLKK